MRGVMWLVSLACLYALTDIACASRPGQSWAGPIGLFTQPTAETLGRGQVALNFAEARFVESNDIITQKNVWYTASVTTMPIDRVEVSVSNRHELLKNRLITSPLYTDLADETVLILHVKYLLMPGNTRRPALAIGVSDVTDATRRIEVFETRRGRRVYLVATYRGASVGITRDARDVGLYGGAKWTISENIDLVMEWVSEPVFVSTTPRPSNPINFNIGTRIYPRELPNLRIDVAAVGDGAFDFGFAFSYLLR